MDSLAWDGEHVSDEQREHVRQDVEGVRSERFGQHDA
jgi:hypothetical protein